MSEEAHITASERNGSQIIVAVVGSTASGKTALGVWLAKRFDGEIINCDSVQVYQGIEIATAKPTAEERDGVPHHLLDFVSPHTNYTAGAWAKDAREKIDEIERRGRNVFIVGGTGFYLRSLRKPLIDVAEVDHKLRERLNVLRERHGVEHLYRMLQRLDPVRAAELRPRDRLRIGRALEVFFHTRAPLSAHHNAHRVQLAEATQEMSDAAALNQRLLLFALAPPRAELYERINRRVEEHFARGLVEEVRALLARGVPPESNALGAHGYRRVVEMLRGERTLENAIEQTKLDVRHYARRQQTWFKREGVRWIEGFGNEAQVQGEVAQQIEAARRKPDQ